MPDLARWAPHAATGGKKGLIPHVDLLQVPTTPALAGQHRLLNGGLFGLKGACAPIFSGPVDLYYAARLHRRCESYA